MLFQDQTLSLIRDLIGKAAEINQLSFSRLLSHWKRRFSTVLQKENALFILNSSSYVLFTVSKHLSYLICEDVHERCTNNWCGIFNCFFINILSNIIHSFCY